MRADRRLDVPTTERERDRPRGREARRRRLLAACLLVLPVLVSGGCLQLIAPYDDQTLREIFAAAREVDQFYGELLESPAGKRQYARYSERYVQIESDLRALVLRNEVRPLNAESTGIAANILTLWRQKKERHMSADTYKSGAAGLDRDRFADMFKYAAMAEKGKPGGGAPGSEEPGGEEPDADDGG